MSMRASPTLIGAFVLGASVLLVAGLGSAGWLLRAHASRPLKRRADR